VDPALNLAGRLGPSSALVALVTLAVIAVIRGWLVPRRSVDQLLSVQAERLAETREREIEWREAAKAFEAQGDATLEALRTLEVLVRAIPPLPSGRE
jgi:small-conductance mechanosensitive channel